MTRWGAFFKMNGNWTGWTAQLLFCVFALSGCSTTSPDSWRDQPVLRVGVAPDYPPIIFKMKGRVAGVEADLARQLAYDLGRPLEFVEMPWDLLIPALLHGRIDVIMSGMSVTPIRKVRVDFCDSYIDNGLMAMIRSRDLEKFESPDQIHNARINVGVQAGTTGDVYMQNNMKNATRMEINQPRDVIYEFQRERVDMFIHDAYAVIWMISENEGDYAGVLLSNDDEQMAWAVRRNDTELRTDINMVLAVWREDGTLIEILEHWLPDNPMLDAIRK